MSGSEAILVRAPNRGALTGEGTNTWIFGRETTVVIDPGPPVEEHLQLVAERASQLGRVVAILCTHHHQDHAGGTGRLAELTGAPLGVFHRRAWRPGELPLHHGDRVLAGSSDLVVQHTPGHAADHLCFWAQAEGVLFCGDLVVDGGSPLISPPDGDMGTYLDSLEGARALGLALLLPGHGDPLRSPAAVLAEVLSHRRRREAEVLEALRAGPARPADLAPLLYSDRPEELWEAAARTLLAHCLKLTREGRARRVGPPDDQLFSAP